MKIIHQRLDGGISITVLSKLMSKEEIEQHAKQIQNSEKNFISYKIIDNNCRIPDNRYFRNAWTYNNVTNTIDIDLNKAKTIKQDNMRLLRKPILDKLDVEFIKAFELNNIKLMEEIANKKQLLRDVTILPLPTDIEELKNFIPDCLKNAE